MSTPHPAPVSALARGLDAAGMFVRQMRREVSARRTIKPMMRYMEIEILEELLTRLCPRSCLEWGAGYSTLHFPGLLDHETTWLSVEHDREWADRITSMNERPNVRVHHVAADRYPWTDADGDGARSDLVGYIDYPIAFAPFDFILVDGRARDGCLEKALELTAENGLVVLHDAQRRHYHRPLADYEHQAWFCFHDRRARGRRERALWLGSKGLPIETVLDVSRHQRIWRFYDAIGTVMKII